MDMKKIRDLFPSRKPIFEGDPGQPPSTGEFDIATSGMPAEAAPSITELSSVALAAAGVETASQGQAAETRLRFINGRPEAPTSPAVNLTERILGDRRLLTIMRQRIHQHRSRRAT